MSVAVEYVFWTIVFDHGTKYIMEKMAISEFKAKCLAVLERVRKTGRPVLVTRFGKPVAQVGPPEPAPRDDDWLGSLAEDTDIHGDIVGPAAPAKSWDALRS